MIINLFSIFDPSIFILSLFPWFLMFLLIFISLVNVFIKLNFFFVKNFIENFVSNEVKPLLGLFKYKGVLILNIILFYSLLLCNFFSLFPFIFTITAHIIIAFPLAFIIWLRIIIFGWLNNRKHLIAHIVPLGTPFILINFIVLIEMISNIIRPITLSVRLTANIVAGHLLLRLLGGFSLISSLNFTLSLFGILVLSILELAVSFIQAYVFITLLTLYSTEIHYE